MENQNLLNIQYSADTSVKTWITFLLLTPTEIQGKKKIIRAIDNTNDKMCREEKQKK